MSLSVWALIAHARERKDCLAGWSAIFGTEFKLIRPFLVICPGEIATTYPGPDGGETLELTRFEGQWVAFSESDLSREDIKLSEADVQLYRLNVAALREHIRQALGVDGSSCGIQPGLECIGTCTQGPKRRRVYWVQSHDESSAIVGAQEVIGRSGTEGCAILTSIGEATDRMLIEAGVSSVGLEDRLKLQPSRVEGGCGIVCRHLEAKDLPIRELKGHLDARLNKISERVVELQVENETLKQDLAKVLDQFASKVEPDFLAIVFAVLAAGSMRGAAKVLGLHKSTLGDRLKGYLARGGYYKTLWSTVAVRNRGVGKKRLERYNDVFAGHQHLTSPLTSKEWREMMDALEAMDEKNWPKIRDELVELLNEQSADT